MSGSVRWNNGWSLALPKVARSLWKDSLRFQFCMATYNGDRYIKAQLQSILKQLTAKDEVIVVDDASTDMTKDVIRSFHDCRVRLIEHNDNHGVLRTFEEATADRDPAVVGLVCQRRADLLEVLKELDRRIARG
jgi:cellulose synthase/poly-beta-1,6-N-acetylglucosamine synthase-like glycosyltransferase